MERKIIMAHQLASSNDLAYVGSMPWHGLGNQLQPQQSIETWQKNSGMNFDILESPVRFISGDYGALGAIHSFPENKVLYRSDTKAPLSVVGSKFRVVQPKEILEFYRDLTEKMGFQIETAGVIKNGRKFWAMAKTGKSATLKGNDQINGYILLATGADGSLATTGTHTSIRVVCQNTLAIALKTGTGSVKVPHNTTFDAQAVKQQLGIAVSNWDEFMYRMKMLSERKVKSNEAMAYFLRVFADQSNEDYNLNERAIKKVQELYDGRGKGAELASSKSTAFGLLNAVTEYIDHERRSKSEDHRMDSAYWGVGATTKQKALETALALAA
jgi:phage/plasmid-like protein (TIGR03299 family)